MRLNWLNSMWTLKIFPTSKSKSAFTLAEILAAISLFALMSVAIASVLGETNSLTQRLRVRQSSVLSAHTALDRMQKDLASAFDEKIQRSPSLFKAEKISTGPQLTFSYLASPILPLFVQKTSGLRIVRYYLEKDSNGSLALFRKEIPYYEFQEIDQALSEKIATGILEWKVELYDPRNDLWITDWDDKGAYTGGYFPGAVRIYMRVVNPNLPPEEQKLKAVSYQTAFLLLNEISEGRR